MYVLTPRLNTYISVQLGWGLSVAMAVWTCLGVSGEHMLMVTFYWQASPQGSMPVLHLLSGLRSAWSDKREFWHGGAKFHVYRSRNVGIQPPNHKNFEFCPQICNSFAQLSRNAQRLYASVDRFQAFNLVAFGGTNNQVISIFPWRSIFPQIFNSP